MLTKKTTKETEYENKSSLYEPKLKLIEKEEINSEIHKRCKGRSGTFFIQGLNSCTPQRGFPVRIRNFPKCRYNTTTGFSVSKTRGSGRVGILTNGFRMNDLRSSTNICTLDPVMRRSYQDDLNDV